jgi:hypothetical protein
MKRRVLTSMATTALLACLLASPARATTSGSGSGAVQIIVTAKAKVEYTIVDQDHIDLRANAPWRLTLEGPDGITTVVGGKTGSVPRRLAVPTGTTAFAVALDN